MLRHHDEASSIMSASCITTIRVSALINCKCKVIDESVEMYTDFVEPFLLISDSPNKEKMIV
jgi:hypothetical protein